MHGEVPLHIRIAVALIGMVLIGAMAVLLVHYGLGTFEPSYDLTASFDTAGHGLDEKSPVKIRGVTVGRVKHISARPNGQAVVTLKMQPGTTVADTATATIEGISVFGPKYIRVEQGAHEVSGPFLADGGQFSGTERSVEFTTVLQKADALLQAIDPNDLATIISTFADSVAGLGPEFGRILDNGALLVDVGVRNLPQAQQFLTDLALLTGSFVEQTPDLTAVIGNLAQVLPTITAHSEELSHLLDRGSQIANQLAGYIGGRGESFGTFIDSAATLLSFFNREIDDFPGLIALLDEVVRNIGNVVHLEVGSPSNPHELVGALYAPGCTLLKMNVPPSPLPGIGDLLPLECPKVLPEEPSP